jgi:hypothetical protein
LIGASVDQIRLAGTVLVVDADGEERPPGTARHDELSVELSVPRNYLRLDDDGLAALGLIVPPADERTPYSANSTVLEIVSMSGCIKGLYRAILRLVGQVMISTRWRRIATDGDLFTLIVIDETPCWAGGAAHEPRGASGGRHGRRGDARTTDRGWHRLDHG